MVGVLEMKEYNLTIVLDEKGGGVREKTTEGLDITDARQVVAILEEYKQRLLGYVINLQSEVDLKNQTKQ